MPRRSRRCQPRRLGGAFQHGPDNPLAGLEGRASLLRRLGEVAAGRPDLFGAPARLGNLYDFWLARRDGLPAPDMLRLVLRALRADLAGAAVSSAACRSAIAAGIRRCRATGSCRFTSSANGWSIR